MKKNKPSIAIKIWSVLSTSERKKALVLLVLMIVGMFMEMLGIGMVIPAISLLTQDNLLAQYPVLNPLMHGLGNPTHKELVMIGMLLLICIYFVKTLFLTFLVWWQTRFVYEMQANQSLRLYSSYLRQPYTFHLQRNSAELIRNIMTETTLFAVTGLNSVMTLLTELLVLLGIFTLLLFVEPKGAIIVVALFVFLGWVYYKLTANRVLGWGKARQYHEGLRLQHLQQGLGGVKEVKLHGRENDFLTEYGFHNFSSARVGQYKAALQLFPRLWLEFLAVIGLAILVLTMIWQGKQMGVIIPTLAVFAAAAFRLMPSANRIISAIQSVRFTLPVFNTIHKELNLADGYCKIQNEKDLSFENAITLERITFKYPSSDVQVLQKISLSIPLGASVGFIGGSGAGKSTLVDIILGLLTPQQGFVKIDGFDIQRNKRSWQDKIGYVPQTIFLTDDSLRRNIAFGLPDEKIDDDAIQHAIKAAQLEKYIDNLPQGLDTIVGERGVRISGGQRQRIGIARALYHDPAVLVLDEATSSLDIETEQGVMQAVKALQGEKTVLIVTHRLSTVEHCDYLYKIEKGKIIDKGMPEIILLKS